MTDLSLAIGHHLLIFAIAGVLAFEIGTVRPGIAARDIARIAGVDLWYGILAAAIIGLGFTRAIFAAKGWSYYATNVFFWAKIVTFLIVGVLSVPPTLTFIRWRRTARTTPAFTPPVGDIQNTRRFLWAEAALFALLPVFAAAMARGYGSWG